MLEDRCKECGGKCCARMPGTASPEDFGAPDRDVMAYRIADVMHSGRWALDCWDGYDGDGDLNGDVYYLRPATVGSEGHAVDRSWGDACTFLTDDGCAIYPSRPYGCRDLVPGPPCYVATEQGSKRGGAMMWLPYQDILRAQ